VRLPTLGEAGKGEYNSHFFFVNPFSTKKIEPFAFSRKARHLRKTVFELKCIGKTGTLAGQLRLRIAWRIAVYFF